MKTRFLTKLAAVITLFVLVAGRASAEDIENFSSGQTYYYNNGTKYINLNTNNQEVSDTAVIVSLYIVVYDYYGSTITSFSLGLTNDNSPLDIAASEDDEDSDGLFEFTPSGYEGSVSYGSIDRGVSVTYTAPGWLSLYRIEVQAQMDVQGNHEGTGDIEVY